MFDNDIIDRLKSAITEHQDDLLDGDGWTLYAPERYTKLGVPTEITEWLEREHVGGQGKYAIFVDGEPITKLKAIHSLDFFETVAHLLNADCSTAARMGGRGSAASAYCAAIKDILT